VGDVEVLRRENESGGGVVEWFERGETKVKEVSERY